MRLISTFGYGDTESLPGAIAYDPRPGSYATPGLRTTNSADDPWSPGIEVSRQSL